MMTEKDCADPQKMSILKINPLNASSSVRWVFVMYLLIAKLVKLSLVALRVVYKYMLKDAIYRVSDYI